MHDCQEWLEDGLGCNVCSMLLTGLRGDDLSRAVQELSDVGMRKDLLQEALEKILHRSVIATPGALNEINALARHALLSEDGDDE